MIVIFLSRSDWLLCFGNPGPLPKISEALTRAGVSDPQTREAVLRQVWSCDHFTSHWHNVVPWFGPPKRPGKKR